MTWYVDASFAVHEDWKGHTGGPMTFGHGTVTSFSQKQKLNTKSSTVAELVGVDDALPQVLWTFYFVEGQGCKVEKNELHQDNISSMKLEKNGKGSSSKRTKHIKIRYFFFWDKIEAGEVSLKYCPTEKMWADILTKPMQGKAFREMRAKLMNCAVDYTDDMMATVMDRVSKKSLEVIQAMVSFKQEGSSPQECVERRQNSVRWGENNVRLVPSQMTDRCSTCHLPTYRWSREKNLRRSDGR